LIDSCNIQAPISRGVICRPYSFVGIFQSDTWIGEIETGDCTIDIIKRQDRREIVASTPTDDERVLFPIFVKEGCCGSRINQPVERDWELQT